MLKQDHVYRIRNIITKKMESGERFRDRLKAKEGVTDVELQGANDLIMEMRTLREALCTHFNIPIL